MCYKFTKRVIDIAVSATALVILFPLFIAIAVLIRLDSPGLPLFFQQRTGLGCRPFNMVKFRSMVSNASELGSWRTEDGDPRITKAGRFVRATSLDELPQLWNVLLGDMSLIGPRPNAPAQQSLYSAADWQGRHRVRPGITGLAQVNGRSDITIEQQTAHDLAYAAQPTLAMDVSIVLKTVQLVLFKIGVN